MIFPRNPSNRAKGKCSVYVIKVVSDAGCEMVEDLVIVDCGFSVCGLEASFEDVRKPETLTPGEQIFGKFGVRSVEVAYEIEGFFIRFCHLFYSFWRNRRLLRYTLAAICMRLSALIDAHKYV